MARLRPLLTELFQRAMGLWRREQRSFADSRFIRASLPGRGPLLIERHCSGFWGLARPPRKQRPEAFGFFGRIFRPLNVSNKRGTGILMSVGGDTGKRYRIKYGFQLNVELLDNKGRTKAVLCFVPEGNLRGWRRHAGSEAGTRAVRDQTRSKLPTSSPSIITDGDAWLCRSFAANRLRATQSKSHSPATTTRSNRGFELSPRLRSSKMVIRNPLRRCTPNTATEIANRRRAPVPSGPQ